MYAILPIFFYLYFRKLEVIILVVVILLVSRFYRFLLCFPFTTIKGMVCVHVNQVKLHHVLCLYIDLPSKTFWPLTMGCFVFVPLFVFWRKTTMLVDGVVRGTFSQFLGDSCLPIVIVFGQFYIKLIKNKD